MKKINLLGASGSIGMQTLDVCLQHPEEFEIVAFSVGKNIDNCIEILGKIPVDLVCVSEKKDADYLKEYFPDLKIVHGEEGLIEVATYEKGDILVNALVGFVGLIPTLKAIEAKKEIALANKETLVVGGELVLEACREHNVKLIPIDSEHSAIFQALQGNKIENVHKLIITASGGSFRNKSREELKDVTVEEALNHPNWKMGPKITIDSATMMNKGFEVIEAHYLFGINYDDIEVVIHPESVIHSMVEYKDHAIMAQLGTPDIRLPIQYALSVPNRLSLNDESVDFVKLKQLTFKEADFNRYPLLKLAYVVGKKAGNLPAVLNGANEMANELFRQGKISFIDIEKLVIEACHACTYKEKVTLQDCIEATEWSKQFVKERTR